MKEKIIEVDFKERRQSQEEFMGRMSQWLPKCKEIKAVIFNHLSDQTEIGIEEIPEEISYERAEEIIMNTKEADWLQNPEYFLGLIDMLEIVAARKIDEGKIIRANF